MCGLPRAAMVSGRWSSATRRRMFGRLSCAVPICINAKAQSSAKAQRNEYRMRFMLCGEQQRGERWAGGGWCSLVPPYFCPTLLLFGFGGFLVVEIGAVFFDEGAIVDFA